MDVAVFFCLKIGLLAFSGASARQWDIHLECQTALARALQANAKNKLNTILIYAQFNFMLRSDRDAVA